MKVLGLLLAASIGLMPLAVQATESWREDPTLGSATFQWTGGGVPDGVSDASSLNTGANADVRSTVVDAINDVLLLLGIIAVGALIIGGLMLLTGQGSDESREKVRKLVINTIVALIIILFARAIVEFYVQAVTT